MVKQIKKNLCAFGIGVALSLGLSATTFAETEEISNVVQTESTDVQGQEFYELCKVVRAEAGANSKEGQKNVVYVILNRLYSNEFPNTLHKVMFQKYQFSCIKDGNYAKADISNFTKENVIEALNDYSEDNNADGALYFTQGWFKFTNSMEYLFTDEVEHNFFK